MTCDYCGSTTSACFEGTDAIYCDNYLKKLTPEGKELASELRGILDDTLSALGSENMLDENLENNNEQ